MTGTLKRIAIAFALTLAAAQTLNAADDKKPERFQPNWESITSQY